MVCFFSYEDLCALQRMEEGQELFKIFGSALDAIIDRVKMHLMYFGKAREYQKSEQFNCVFLEYYKNFTVKIDFLKTGSTKKVVVSFKGFADQPPVAFVNFFKKLLVDDNFLKKHWVGMIQGLVVAAGAGFLFKHNAQVGNARRCFSSVKDYLGQQISDVFNDVAKSTLHLARNIPGQELLGLTLVEQYQQLCARYPSRYGYLAGSGNTLEEIVPGMYVGQYVPNPEIGVLVVDLDKFKEPVTIDLTQFPADKMDRIKKGKKRFFLIENDDLEKDFRHSPVSIMNNASTLISVFFGYTLKKTDRNLKYFKWSDVSMPIRLELIYHGKRQEVVKKIYNWMPGEEFSVLEFE
ncbi:hypothetical protein FJ366_02470 [Candidatus Dependentiae bacterium]|nr:hypothetical protein [Candidatus Dependentiae bacterium]